jgi:hypothetical protein
MSVIQSSSVLLGSRSADSLGTARNRTVRSITTSMQGRASTASAVHSRRPARGGLVWVESFTAPSFDVSVVAIHRDVGWSRAGSTR